MWCKITPVGQRRRNWTFLKKFTLNISLDTKPHDNVDDPMVIASWTFDLTGSSYV